MKNIIKLLVCFTCIFSLAGCGDNKKDPDSNEKDEPVTTENDNKDKEIKSEFFEGYEENLELSVYDYQIKLPKDYLSTNSGIRTKSIKCTTSKGKEIGVLITTSKIQSNLKQTFSLEKINEYFKTSREADLNLIFLNDGEVTYNDQPVEATVNKKEALLDKGVANDSDEEICKYAVYYFFLDEEDEYPCEFFVGSRELEPDELAKIAEEMIGMIEEVE